MPVTAHSPIDKGQNDCQHETKMPALEKRENWACNPASNKF